MEMNAADLPNDRSVTALLARWEQLAHATPEEARAAHAATSRIQRRARLLERSFAEAE